MELQSGPQLYGDGHRVEGAAGSGAEEDLLHQATGLGENEKKNEKMKMLMKNVYFQTHRSFYIIFS